MALREQKTNRRKHKQNTTIKNVTDSPLILNDETISTQYTPILHHHDVLNVGPLQEKYKCSSGCHFEQQTEEDIKMAQKARVGLILASIFCIVFMIGEIFAGYFAHSIALMSDALHLLSDFGGFLISIFAIIMSQRDATKTHTFGYHRVEIIGALFSVILIWILTIGLVYEAIRRLLKPTNVDGEIMFITACCGIVVNLFMGVILHKHSHTHSHSHSDSNSHSHSQINVRSAYIHVLGDLIQSIGVLIAATLIWYDHEKYHIADPICTLCFSVIIMFTTYKLMRDILSVIMQSVPKDIDCESIATELTKLTDVSEVHDLHVWNLSLGKPTLSVHLVVKPTGLESLHVACTDQILRKAQKILSNKFGIQHSTIQIEWPHDHGSITHKEH